MPLTTPNIPGFTFTAKDGGLIATPARPLTDSVTVVGSALDGPKNRIVYVSRLQTVDDLFGPVKYNYKYVDPNAGSGSVRYSGNSLSRGVHEVFLGGCADIRAVRVGGTIACNVFAGTNGTSGVCAYAAAGTIGSGGITCTSLTLTAPYAGRVYNTVCLSGATGSTYGTVNLIQGLKSPVIRTYYTSATKTWAELANEINADSYNVSMIVQPSGNIANLPCSAFLGAVIMSGGTNGTDAPGCDYASDRYGLYTLLTESTTGVFMQLREYETDIIYMAAMPLNDATANGSTSTSIAVDLAKHCYITTRDHYPTIGVIGVKPLSDWSYAGISTYVTSGLTDVANGNYDANTKTIKAGYFMKSGFIYADPDVGSVDTGRYISVVAGPDVNCTHPDLGLYSTNPAGIYAGMISALSAESASTYKKIPGTEALKWNFTQAQINTLLAGVGQNLQTGFKGGGAYVCLMNLYNRGTVVASDVTAAQRTSDYSTLQILRIVHYAMATIKDVAINYIGMPNHTEVLLALRQDVKKELDAMAELRMINGKENVGYTFEVVSEGYDPVLGVVNINLTLRPAFEIKTINVTVNVRQ